MLLLLQYKLLLGLRIHILPNTPLLICVIRNQCIISKRLKLIVRDILIQWRRQKVLRLGIPRLRELLIPRLGINTNHSMLRICSPPQAEHPYCVLVVKSLLTQFSDFPVQISHLYYTSSSWLYIAIKVLITRIGRRDE